MSNTNKKIEIIEIDCNNDDDEDDKINKKSSNREIIAIDVDDSDDVRPRSENIFHDSQERKRRKVVSSASIKSNNSDTTNDNGCMLNPKNCIKLFASESDIARRTTDNNNKSAFNCNINTHCWSIREQFGLDKFNHISRSGIDWIVFTAYQLDFDFLLNEIPELNSIQTVVLIYHYLTPSMQAQTWVQQQEGSNKKNRIFLKLDPSENPRTKTNPTIDRHQYGTHHTKMILIGYRSGRLRVNIHTSNFGVEDFVNGAFIQDFLPKKSNASSSSTFEDTLIYYLESYNFINKFAWGSMRNGQQTASTTLVSHLKTYDFSTAVGILIPSIPGYHEFGKGEVNNNKLCGYLKVEKAIHDTCYLTNNNKNNNGDEDGSSIDVYNTNPIICQFTSIGRLDEMYLDKIATAWNAVGIDDDNPISSQNNDKKKNIDNNDKRTSPSKLSRDKGTDDDDDDDDESLSLQNNGKKKRTNKDKGVISSNVLRFVWPVVEDIANSVEGLGGGAIVMGRSKNLKKDFILSKLHRWKSTGINSDPLDKSKHVPHIKSFYQVDGSNGKGDDSMRWFVIGSHNMSKAAWGQIQNRKIQGKVLAIFSWELSVFVSPQTLGVDLMGPLVSSEGYSLGSSSSPGGNLQRKPLNSQQLREKRLARFLPDNSNNFKQGDIKAENRAIIPLPYKFLPDKYEPSDLYWHLELLE